jgi:gamma-glutamyltranspeptidase/glutathione hydrolase
LLLHKSTKYGVFFLLFLYSHFCYAAAPAPVQGKQGMVVTGHPLASKVGLEILQQGGNAIDAAVAVGYALAVVDPCCGNIGGGGFMLIRLANGKNIFINFREKAPLALTAELFLQKNNELQKLSALQEHIAGDTATGYLNVGVPGTVLGLNTALKKYGTFSREKILAPAIRLAQDGFILTQGDINILNRGTKSFKEQANVAAIFLKNGEPYQVGDRLKQTDLANTLTAIAKKGNRVFYLGEIAKKIVTASKQQHGFLSEKDFANYTVEERPVITCNYRGYEVIASPPPSSGGVAICEALNIVEAYPLKILGFHAAASAHYALEAMRYAYADRNSFLGDPNFINNPTEKLISKEYARQIQKKISPDKTTNSFSIGFISSPEKKSQEAKEKAKEAVQESQDTTSYSVVDRWGNAVAVTYTINHYFGAKVIADHTGFFLNNELGDFTLKPGIPNAFGLIENSNNVLAPGKRPLSSMAPTILTKDNQLYMVLGTPGGSTIPTQLIQVIQNVIDYGMNIKEATDAARFHMQWLPDKVYLEPYTFSEDTLKILRNMGYQFKYGIPFGSLYWGSVMAILKDQNTGLLLGGADSRRNGLAAGY